MTDLDKLKELLEQASPRPWMYNSYSAIYSGPMCQVYEDFWTEERYDDGHTYEHRVGKTCPACGERPAFLPNGKRFGTYWDCALAGEALDADAIVAHVPASMGDTATGVRKVNAQLIEEAVNALPELIADNERMRAMLAGLGFCPTDGDSMPCTTCGAGL